MTTPAELRAQIDVKGAEISILAEEIEAKFRDLKNWRRNIEEAPLRTMATAMGAGLVISGVAIPLVRTVARQTSVAIKTSLAAYLTALFTNKLRQLTER